MIAALRLTEEQLQAHIARIGKMSVRRVEKLKMDAPVTDEARAAQKRAKRAARSR